ncbi:fc receptor [Fusarium beomiforme]|uniref:Fc receptor n=1 Tax=Fusarium beomiforme TaxID=44412 RepID=A0A9P5A976_9HYPO|nr:fc receptor [Fusarium beomiforme]
MPSPWKLGFLIAPLVPLTLANSGIEPRQNSPPGPIANKDWAAYPDAVADYKVNPDAAFRNIVPRQENEIPETTVLGPDDAVPPPARDIPTGPQVSEGPTTVLEIEDVRETSAVLDDDRPPKPSDSDSPNQQEPKETSAPANNNNDDNQQPSTAVVPLPEEPQETTIVPEDGGSQAPTTSIIPKPQEPEQTSQPDAQDPATATASNPKGPASESPSPEKPADPATQTPAKEDPEEPIPETQKPQEPDTSAPQATDPQPPTPTVVEPETPETSAVESHGVNNSQLPGPPTTVQRPDNPIPTIVPDDKKPDDENKDNKDNDNKDNDNKNDNKDNNDKEKDNKEQDNKDQDNRDKDNNDKDNKDNKKPDDPTDPTDPINPEDPKPKDPKDPEDPDDDCEKKEPIPCTKTVSFYSESETYTSTVYVTCPAAVDCPAREAPTITTSIYPEVSVLWGDLEIDDGVLPENIQDLDNATKQYFQQVFDDENISINDALHPDAKCEQNADKDISRDCFNLILSSFCHAVDVKKGAAVAWNSTDNLGFLHKRASLDARRRMLRERAETCGSTWLFEFDWSGASNMDDCFTSCEDSMYAFSDECFDSGNTFKEGSIDVGCGSYKYKAVPAPTTTVQPTTVFTNGPGIATSDGSSCVLTALSTQCTTTSDKPTCTINPSCSSWVSTKPTDQPPTPLAFKPVVCEKESDYPKHPDISPDFQAGRAGVFCGSGIYDNKAAKMGPGSKPYTAVHKGGKTNYVYQVSWIEGCKTTVSEQDVSQPTGDKGPRCAEVFKAAFKGCNNGGVGGLPSVGRREGKPPATLTDDVNEIISVVEKLLDQDQDIILLAHSYSGVPATQCLETLSRKVPEVEGKKGGVSMIIYMAAVALPVGGSVLSLLEAPDFLKIEETFPCTTH